MTTPESNSNLLSPKQKTQSLCFLFVLLANVFLQLDAVESFFKEAHASLPNKVSQIQEVCGDAVLKAPCRPSCLLELASSTQALPSYEFQLKHIIPHSNPPLKLLILSVQVPDTKVDLALPFIPDNYSGLSPPIA